MGESDDFVLVTLSPENVERVRNTRKRRLVNAKIKELKDKIIQYQSRKEDIEDIQSRKEEYEGSTEREENMAEEVKLMDVRILEYEKLIRRLQREYCNIKV